MKTHTKIKVRGYHIDLFGHVNHSRYLEFLEEGRWDYMEKNRLFDLFHETGMLHVVTRLTVDYRNSARAGEILAVETGLLRAGTSSFTMGQQVRLEGTGKTAAEAEVINVLVDAESRKKAVPDSRLIDGWKDLAAKLKRGGQDG